MNRSALGWIFFVLVVLAFLILRCGTESAEGSSISSLSMIQPIQAQTSGCVFPVGDATFTLSGVEEEDLPTTVVARVGGGVVSGPDISWETEGENFVFKQYLSDSFDEVYFPDLVVDKISTEARGWVPNAEANGFLKPQKKICETFLALVYR